MDSTPRSALRSALLVMGPAVVMLSACMDNAQTKKVAKDFATAAPRPDQIPVMLNTELPFRYPAALYARRVQGNVTLRLFIDREGKVHADSTRVEESSGYASLDSAAVRGSGDLRFAAAKLHGQPIGVSILFPVFFRHPAAAPLPGDTILRQQRSHAASAAPRSSASPPAARP